MFCPQCGVDHHAGEREAEQITRAEVDIARIQADRDVAIAKLGAKAAAEVAETEAAAETAHAEGVVEGVEAGLEAIIPAAPEVVEGDGEPVPVVIDAEPEPEPPAAPPPPETPETPASITEQQKKAGYWDYYH